MTTIFDLLGFMDDLMRLQYLDSHWITSRGASCSCDVAEVVGWFYQLFLMDLMHRKDISDELREYIKELRK